MSMAAGKGERSRSGGRLRPAGAFAHRVGRWLAAGALATMLFGCGKSVAPDAAPPAAVTDLSVAAATDSTVTLTWTAPGDDGSQGQAARYDLRYSLQPLATGWDSATVVTGLPPPQPAGRADSVRVGPLARLVPYDFALETLDEAGNASALSNVIQAAAGDAIPPGKVTDLAAVNPGPHAVTLAFTAPGDDGDTGQAAAYAVRSAPTPITEATWSAASPVPVDATPGPAGSHESIRLEAFTPGQTVHLALRARDQVGLYGPVSNDVVVSLPPDTIPPAAITDLAVASVGPFSATLAWTAPGNDGTEARATGYAVRYAATAITATAWDTATVVPVSLVPASPGARDTLSLTGLPGGRTLYFCVRARDEAENIGAVSNPASGFVRLEPRTWKIYVDGSGDAPTIQAGIDSSRDGDLVLVYPGTYYEHIDFHGKNVHLKSDHGPESTIVDGSLSAGPAVTFQSGETREASIESLTITGGTGTPNPVLSVGGGIYCQDASPSIIGNAIRNNTAGFPGRGFGGGIFIDGSAGRRPLINPIIRRNTISLNRAATNGGALTVGDSETLVEDNVFSQNSCAFDGGAVYLAMGDPGSATFVSNMFVENLAGDHGGAIEAGQQGYQSPPLLIQDNLFARNEAHGEDLPTDSGTGGAIAMSGWSGTIANNTFVGNIGTGGAPCTGGAVLITAGHKPVFVRDNIFAASNGCAVACRFGADGTDLSDNIFWSNQPGDVGNPSSCFPYIAEDNLFADPLFCDPANDDYHVRRDSPALSDTLKIGAFTSPGCSP